FTAASVCSLPMRRMCSSPRCGNWQKARVARCRELIALRPSCADQSRGDSAQLLATLVVDDCDDRVLAGNRSIGRPVGFGQIELAGLVDRLPLGGILAERFAGQVADAED